ncbi:chloride channel protein EriC [Candidatus Magnetoovum chiemensis]|nr:chloride channel protein EriC [Candidatus Magnetoovum chiemensis]
MTIIGKKSRKPLVNIFTFKLDKHTKTIVVSLIIGVLSSGAAIVFIELLHFIKENVFIHGQELLHIGENLSSRLYLPLLPIIGAVLLIPLSLLFPGEVNGYAFPKFLENVNLKGGIIGFKTIAMRMLGSAITIGTGGSAGVEGPSASIGGGIGSIIGQRLGVSSKTITVMIASGSAGAIAAAFNAPIAGVMFAIEIILLGNYELMSFGAVVISSGMACAVSRAYFGQNAAFTVPEYEIVGIIETPFYLILGLAVGVIAFLYIKTFYKVKDFFDRLKTHHLIKPVIGAFIVGAIGIFFPQVMSDGYENITKALYGDYGIVLAVCLLCCKILATSITLGSGGAGGVFAPALFIGSMAGGAYGKAVTYFFPQYTSSPGAYATVGVGAFLAATTHAPLTGMFLLFEMTGNYKIIIPIMFASITGVFMAKKLSNDSIDTAELARRGIDLHAGRETSILQAIKVKEVMRKDFTVIKETCSINEVSNLIIHGKGMYFPVIKDTGDMMGIISMQDIKAVMLEEYIKNIVSAGELATEDVIVLKNTDNLKTALELFSIKDIDEIPVVDILNRQKVVGMLHRGDVIAAYNREVLKRQSEEANF